MLSVWLIGQQQPILEVLCDPETPLFSTIGSSTSAAANPDSRQCFYPCGWALPSARLLRPRGGGRPRRRRLWPDVLLVSTPRSRRGGRWSGLASLQPMPPQRTEEEDALLPISMPMLHRCGWLPDASHTGNVVTTPKDPDHATTPVSLRPTLPLPPPPPPPRTPPRTTE
jgi:hypothetical protein